MFHTFFPLLTILLLLLSSHSIQALGTPSFMSYYSDKELEDRLREIVARFPACAKLLNIGSSAQGRPIWALEISDRPGVVEPEPNIKFVGNTHGDEPIGRVLLPAFAEFLCESFSSAPSTTTSSSKAPYQPRVTTASDQRTLAARLVRDTHLYLIPSLNPDGYNKHRRENGQNQDLNRNFPDPGPHRDDYPALLAHMQPSGQEQPETNVMMRFITHRHFVASAALHEGALVANYPWDASPDGRPAYAATPDDATFIALARLYADHHPVMKTSNQFNYKDGITNGAAWYAVHGGQQDWNYVVGRCLELTLEISDDKWPEVSLLEALYHDNLNSMLMYSWVASWGGVAGSVRSKGDRGVVQGAKVEVVGVGLWPIEVEMPHGVFFRPLAPGEYRVRVVAEGFKTLETRVTVPGDGSGARLHVLLSPTSLKEASTATTETGAKTLVDDLPLTTTTISTPSLYSIHASDADDKSTLIMGGGFFVVATGLYYYIRVRRRGGGGAMKGPSVMV